jgi:hypothetical protein
MPRLTNQDYLARRHLLIRAWKQVSHLYSVLPTNQQWDLHRYYQTLVGATPNQLLANRAELTKADPSFPHRTGKSFSYLCSGFRWAFANAHGDELQFRQLISSKVLPSAKTSEVIRTHHQPDRTISVRTMARPEPDIQKLVAVVRELAIQLGEEQAKAKKTEKPKNQDQSEAA